MERDETRAAWTSLVLLERFRGGDDPAAEALFARYFDRLTPLARSRLSARLARRTDPEDIVLSVYRSFFVGAREGRFTLEPRRRPLAAAGVHHQAQAAPAGPASDAPTAGRSTSRSPLDQVDEGRSLRREREPTPEEALALADELEWVFAQLDPFGRRVLELRLQGLQISAIAEDTGPLGAHGPAHAGPDPRHCWPSGSTMTDDEFESRLLRFEQAWRREGPREIADFLDGPLRTGSTGATPVARRADLHRPGISLAGLASRLRNAITLEDYVAKFPELGPLDRLPLELIGEEYRVRHRWGDRPSHAEFLSRFPARREQIRAELLADRSRDRGGGRSASRRRRRQCGPPRRPGTSTRDPGRSPALAPRLPAAAPDRRGEDGEGLRGVAAQRRAARSP